MVDSSVSPQTVLFIGTANTARSVMAEAALRRYAAGRFLALSAGTAPAGEVHRQTLRVLQILNYRTDTLHSKSLNRFVAPDGPQVDFVFTVSAAASHETMPRWAGRPILAHWKTSDPTASFGSDDHVFRAFRTVFLQIEMRIKAFVALPLEGLSDGDRQIAVDIIGQPLPPVAVAE